MVHKRPTAARVQRSICSSVSLCHWHVNRVNSYADVASTARSINATPIYVYGGAPMSFMFFMPGEVEISFWTETGGYYICYAYP